MRVRGSRRWISSRVSWTRASNASPAPGARSKRTTRPNIARTPELTSGLAPQGIRTLAAASPALPAGTAEPIPRATEYEHSTCARRAKQAAEIPYAGHGAEGQDRTDDTGFFR